MAATAQISGRIGQTPELNYTHGGVPVINISIASNRQRKNEEGERVSIADWFRVTIFGRDAEIIAEYAKKGSALAFNGRLLTDSYTDREGQQRTATYLIADSFEFVPAPKSADEAHEVRADIRPSVGQGNPLEPGADTSEIPF